MRSKSQPRMAWAYAWMGVCIGGLAFEGFFYFTNSPKFNSARLPALLVLLAVSSWVLWRKRQKARLGEPYSKTF